MSEEVNLFLSKLVLHGESILAEIFRLSKFVPKDFRDPTKSQKFRSIVQLDFKYLSKVEQIEKELEKDLKLQTQFYATFEPVLIAFEQLFTSIAEFVHTFTSYAREIEVIGRIDIVNKTAQLETYCLYISGLLLIYLDSYLPGPIRERIYVAIYRKSDVRENAEFLVDFLRTTTGSNELMGKRIHLPESFIRFCVHTIEVSETATLKIPKTHLMFVALHFDQPTLINDSQRMIKIVNSIYRDTWVINLGFGVIANIFDAWYNCKAAWNSLNSTMTQQEAQILMKRHLKTMEDANFPQVISEMTDFDVHLQQVTVFNRSLKWLYLHSRPALKTSRPLKDRPPTDDQLFQWLLDVSRCEILLLNLYTTTLDNRETAANSGKLRIRELLHQLAEFFEHGFVKMSEAQKTNFVKWVRNLSDTVENINVQEAEQSVETIQQIVRRVKQVGELLGLSINITLKECLTSLDSELRSLLSILSVSESTIPDVYLKMESTYLWPLISHLIPRIQQNLISTSNTDVVRQIFTKLSISCFTLKMRLSEFGADRRDHVASRIANTYSYSLEKHLRTVLQSVPQHLFGILHSVIVPALGKSFQPYIEKTELRDLSEYVSASKLVETTCLIANTSMGISRMMLTKVGTIEINPKELLEDGMIRQLYKEIKKLMNAPGATSSIDNLLKTCVSVETLRSSFLYLCDYMNLDGERVWSVSMDDYFSRISEERAFAKSSGELEPNEIAQFIMSITHPKISRYSEATLSWKDLKMSKNVLSFDVFDRIERIVPFHILTSIETNVTIELEKLVIEYVSSARKLGVTFNLQNAVTHTTAYNYFSGPNFEKLVRSIQPQSVTLATVLAQIGQLIMLLRTICHAKQLSNRLKEDSMQRDLIEISRSMARDPTDLPAEMETILKLMMQYSLYNPEKMIFRLKDEPSPLFMIALVQCVLPRVGDAYFVCPKQLEVGIRFVLRQSRLLPYYLPIIQEQLPRSIRPKKRVTEVDRFLRQLVINL